MKHKTWMAFFSFGQLLIWIIFFIGCGMAEYKWYLIDHDTPSYQEGWEQGKEHKGLSVDFGFSRSYRNIGIPLIFEVRKSVGPYMPGIGVYSYDEIDYIIINYVKLVFESGNTIILDKVDMPIRIKMEYNKFYKRFEARHSFAPIEIDFETVESFNADIEIEGYKNDKFICSKIYTYRFKKVHEEGFGFFPFLHLPT